MKALILAGGFGVRLKEVIHDRPKVMALINGRPFLEYVLEVLRKDGIKEVVISVGYLGDFIKNHFGDGKKFGVKIDYSEEKYPLGTAGAVRKAQRFFKETFLVINGDTYLDTDLAQVLSFHESKKTGATIVLAKRKSTLESGLVLKGRSGKIACFLEKPKKDREGLVNSGYYVFEPNVLKFIRKGKRSSLEKEIFPFLAKKGKLYGIDVEEDFIDVGTPETYQEAQKVLSKKKRKIVKARAPVRISFAGGGTDLPSYFLKESGCVISGTIDKYAHVTIKTIEAPLIKGILRDYQREESYPLGKSLPYDGGVFDLYKAIINRIGLNLGVEIEVEGDFPAGSGLGSSSSIAIALIGALLKLKGQKVTKKKVARLAIEVEREILKIPGGWQDQYASSFGGINFIEFLPKGKVKITSLTLSEKKLRKLEDNLMLFYLGGKRSERFQQEYLTKQIKKEKKTKEAMGSLKELAKKAYRLLEKGEIAKFGALLHRAWLAKKKSSKRISTGFVDKIYDKAIKMGGRGGKLLGAGGGGCLLVNASPRKKEKIIKSLEKDGARLLPFKFDFEGLKVETYEA